VDEQNKLRCICPDCQYHKNDPDHVHHGPQPPKYDEASMAKQDIEYSAGGYPMCRTCGLYFDKLTELKEHDSNVHVPKNKTLAKQPHYTHGGIDVIDYAKAKLTPEQLEGAYWFNVNKYLGRYQYKGEAVNDLKKAQVYLEWLIKLKEKK